MVNFELHDNSMLSEKEKALLKEAKKKPIVYDEDSPQLTADMEQAFMAARKEKAYHGEPVTLYVAPETLAKVKDMGADYIAILGRLLDKAVKEYHIS